MLLRFRLLPVLVLLRFVRCELDDYLQESRQQCMKKSVSSCVKYRTLKYITALGSEYGLLGNGTNGTVKFVTMDNYHGDTEIFPTARQLPTDTELTKFVKFVKRQANYYLGSKALVFELPKGVEVMQPPNQVEEARGRIKKKEKAAIMLLPLIILFKLFKIKLMMVLALGSLAFIKKAILLGALVLPSIVQKLKHCTAAALHHHTPYHIEDIQHDHDFESGHFGGYAKDYERAYDAYVNKHKGA